MNALNNKYLLRIYYSPHYWAGQNEVNVWSLLLEFKSNKIRIYIYQKKPQIIQKHIDTKYSEHSHPPFLKTNTVSIFLSHGLVVPIQHLAQCSINIVEITWE